MDGRQEKSEYTQTSSLFSLNLHLLLISISPNTRAGEVLLDGAGDPGEMKKFA